MSNLTLCDPIYSFTSPDAEGARTLYKSQHPTDICALKCMDGRLNLSIITQTPTGTVLHGVTCLICNIAHQPLTLSQASLRPSATLAVNLTWDGRISARYFVACMSHSQKCRKHLTCDVSQTPSLGARRLGEQQDYRRSLLPATRHVPLLQGRPASWLRWPRIRHCSGSCRRLFSRRSNRESFRREPCLRLSDCCRH